MKKIFKIQFKDSDTRLDKWLRKNFSSLKQSFLEKNLRKGFIKVNKKKIKSKYKLQKDDEIEIFNYTEERYKNVPKSNLKKIISQDLLKKFKSSIIYENSNFIIFNKWSGIATQGGSKINISIDDIIKNISFDYNLVHRLDRETSGLLIIAKNLEYTKIFGKLFKEKKITKIYVAICQGKPKHSESLIQFEISAKNTRNKNTNSITRYKIVKNKNKLSIILFYPITGKTHQIRIVSKHLGCPIIGDTKYNNQNKFPFEKLKLNSHLLEFEIENKKFKFLSIFPTDFTDFIKKNNLSSVKKNDLVDFKNF